jgi:hypothetical protein
MTENQRLEWQLRMAYYVRFRAEQKANFAISMRAERIIRSILLQQIRSAYTAFLVSRSE